MAVHVLWDFPNGIADIPEVKRLAAEQKAQGQKSTLTTREVQILAQLAEGQSNKVIANALSITEDTVKQHLKSLYEKLGASDRAHAVAIALRQRLIE